MICRPCATAADDELRYQQITGVASQSPDRLTRRHPKACGCPCQHRPITPAPTRRNPA